VVTGVPTAAKEGGQVAGFSGGETGNGAGKRRKRTNWPALTVTGLL